MLLHTETSIFSAAAFRMILTPIDTVKTTLQAQGSTGIDLLRQRFKKYGIATLWWGAFATAGATFVGHYPWFATVRWKSLAEIWPVLEVADIVKYNFLTETIQEPPKSELLLWLLRLALIGFVASIVSDSVSNSLRVVKTYRQVNDTKVSYSMHHGPTYKHALLIHISRCCQAGGSRGWDSRASREGTFHKNFVQWSPRNTVFHIVEAVSWSVRLK